MALHKLEAMIEDVPASTWGWKVNGGTTRYITAGDYYLSSGVSGGSTFLAEFQTRLRLDVANTVVSLDDATGKVTIAWGSGTPALAWQGTGGVTLRNLLGFVGDLSAAASHTGTQQAKPLWLPDCWPNGQAGSIAALGSRASDRRVMRAQSGRVWVTCDNRYTEHAITFATLSKARTWEAEESTTNESAESFWEDYLSGGTPFRIYTDRADDSSYLTTASEAREYVFVGTFEKGNPVRVLERTDARWSWTLDMNLKV